ncbi:hypothetical protein Rleg5DRAFT_5149 [Rhizobium leguminosarum bv. viciae WSM1455]|jgi:hypothetical protein|nr:MULTISPECIES: hypothetical protein [Rhizobium]EJC69359.1 hypothetical protein Rleg5DRAFT_5149 [Rhizobium leguminosarum bv. viciae WSM1455]NEK36297.1 hypothetical protein [Rhizobium leguminosarum]
MNDTRGLMGLSAMFAGISLLALYFDNPGAIITSNLVVLALCGYGFYRV